MIGLHYAVSSKNDLEVKVLIVKKLLAEGANANLVDKQRRLPRLLTTSEVLQKMLDKAPTINSSNDPLVAKPLSATLEDTFDSKTIHFLNDKKNSRKSVKIMAKSSGVRDSNDIILSTVYRHSLSEVASSNSSVYTKKEKNGKKENNPSDYIISTRSKHSSPLVSSSHRSNSLSPSLKKKIKPSDGKKINFLKISEGVKSEESEQDEIYQNSDGIEKTPPESPSFYENSSIYRDPLSPSLPSKTIKRYPSSPRSTASINSTPPTPPTFVPISSSSKTSEILVSPRDSRSTPSHLNHSSLLTNQLLSPTIQLVPLSSSNPQHQSLSIKSPTSERKKDRWGFFKDDEHPSPSSSSSSPSQKLEKELKLSETRREMKWMKMLKDWDLFSKKKKQTFKSRIYKGIPDSVSLISYLFLFSLFLFILLYLTLSLILLYLTLLFILLYLTLLFILQLFSFYLFYF